MTRPRWLVALLEERSAKEMLLGLLPRFFGNDYASVSFLPLVFEGKNDLQRNLERRIRGWQAPEKTCFLVLHDQDSNDCRELADSLRAICLRAGRKDTVVRIACRELESWYLGDLAAVESALGLRQLGGKQAKKKYRAPDRLHKPS